MYNQDFRVVISVFRRISHILHLTRGIDHGTKIVLYDGGMQLNRLNIQFVLISKEG